MAVTYERGVAEDLELGRGTVTRTMPAGGTAQGSKIGLHTFGFAWFNIVDYGAQSGGVSGCKTAIQAAIDACAAAGGGTVFVPNGTYRVEGLLSISTAQVHLEGESRTGAILLWDDTPNMGLDVDTIAPADAWSDLTVNAAVGDRTVTVASGATFIAGDWVFLEDTAANTGSLMTRVHSVAGDVVTLDDAVPCALMVADVARLYRQRTYPLLEGIVIHHLTLGCVSGTPTQFLTLLRLSRCAKFVVEDCYVKHSKAALISTRETYNGRIVHSVCEGTITVSGTGIENLVSTGLLVEHNTISLCQFGVTFASSPYCRTIGNRINGRQTNIALGRGIRYGQSSNFGVIVGNTISDTNLFGIYMQDSAYATIQGNTISFTGSATDPGEQGIQLGGYEEAVPFTHHCVIVGNNVRGASGYGIAINMGIGGVNTLTSIVGNTVSGCLWGAVYCNGNQNTISGNTLATAGATSAGSVLKIGPGGDYNVLSGNTLTNEDTTPIAGIHTTDGGGHNTVGPNVLTTPSVLTQTLHATDTWMASRWDLPKPPIVTTTVVGTPASTAETTAWDILIPANTLTAAGQGFHGRGFFTAADNTNNKRARVKIGAITVEGVSHSGGDTVMWLSFDVVYVTPTAGIFFAVFDASRADASAYLPGGSYANLVIDWTVNQHVLVTLVSDAGVANELVWRMGRMLWDGVPNT